MLEDIPPIHAADPGDIEDVLQLVRDLDKSNILEIKLAVGDNGLELLAQRHHVLRGLKHVASPVYRIYGILDKQFRTMDGLRDDALGDDTIYAGVVVVLIAVIPEVKACERAAVKVLRREDARTGNRRLLVRAIYLLYVMQVSRLGEGCGTVGCSHDLHCLRINVDAGILSLDG